jgi:hypothetical protein
MEVHRDGTFEVTPDRLRALNEQVLDGLEVEDHVVPGGFRTGDIVVGNVHKGAPAQDCAFLVATLCDWLNGADATWVNYVHSMFPDRTLTARRQRDLALALEHDSYTSRTQLTTLTRELAEAYAGKGSKTVTRDLNALSKLDLIERTPKGIRAKRELILSFLPRVTPGSEEDLSLNPPHGCVSGGVWRCWWGSVVRGRCLVV